jgi:Ca-activated chloride channel family protein
MRRLYVAVLAIGLLCPPIVPLSAQQDDTTIGKSLKVDVELVLINASVTDARSRAVTDLEQGQFRIWEDKIEQKVEYFSSEDVPASIGIIFDVSGSMGGNLPAAKQAASKFLNTGNLQDEYFLIEFSDLPKITQGFTARVSNIETRLTGTFAGGSTALFDAIYVGLKKVATGMHSKKALILITDGEDNSSRYTFSELKEFVREQDVQVYSIALLSTFSSLGNSLGLRPRVAEISEVTGGQAYFPKSVRELEGICARIAVDMKNQYVIGYRSTNQVKDGGWRKVQLKVSPKEGQARLSVRSRTGYYAAAAGFVPAGREASTR